MSNPGKQDFARLLADGGIRLDPAQIDLLWRFHQLLREADAKLNLTRIRAFDAMVEKHYIDSLLPATLHALTGPVMDLGSGGGFPGIPMAIQLPDVAFKLVEGRRLRAGFLLNVASSLGLRNVEVVARKLNPEDRIPVTTVVTRAFSAIDDTLSRVDASVAEGGQAVLMKGPNCDEEIAIALARFPHWRLEADRAYALPFSGDARRLVVLRKAGSPARRPIAITSADNARVKTWRKLQQAKSIRAEGQALLAGDRYIRELLESRPDVVRAVVDTETRSFAPAADAQVETVRVSKDLMRDLDAVSGEGPLAVCEAPVPEAWPGPEAMPSGLTLLLATQLPDNVGAILRSAEAFGVAHVVLLEECASPYLPKALRASGPAPWRLRLWRGPRLADLRAAGTSLVALDLEGTPLPDFATRRPERLALIVGMEGPGTRALATGIPRVTIPVRSGVDSLNAAVAAGIAMYALQGGTKESAR